MKVTRTYLQRVSFCHSRDASYNMTLLIVMDLSMLANPTHKPLQGKSLILVVDNNEDNLLLIACVLESFFCQAIVTTSSEEALSLAREHLPDLIIAEMVLPEMSGIELVTRLRQDRFTKKIPVIAVTTMARREDRDRIFEVGCDNYLCKPFLIDKLEEILSYYCRKIAV
jgi:two-component system, cell cycle response regulator DivK